MRCIVVNLWAQLFILWYMFWPSSCCRLLYGPLWVESWFIATCKASCAPLLVIHAHLWSWSREVNHETGRSCLWSKLLTVVRLMIVNQEAGIGSWKSYEVGWRHHMKPNGVPVWIDCASFVISGWCCTNKCSLLVWLMNVWPVVWLLRALDLQWMHNLNLSYWTNIRINLGHRSESLMVKCSWNVPRGHKIQRKQRSLAMDKSICDKKNNSGRPICINMFVPPVCL